MKQHMRYAHLLSGGLIKSKSVCNISSVDDEVIIDNRSSTNGGREYPPLQ